MSSFNWQKSWNSGTLIVTQKWKFIKNKEVGIFYSQLLWRVWMYFDETTYCCSQNLLFLYIKGPSFVVSTVTKQITRILQLKFWEFGFSSDFKKKTFICSKITITRFIQCLFYRILRSVSFDVFAYYSNSVFFVELNKLKHSKCHHLVYAFSWFLNWFAICW